MDDNVLKELNLLKMAKWIGINRPFCLSVVMFHKKFFVKEETNSVKLLLATYSPHKIIINKKTICPRFKPVVFNNNSQLCIYSYDLSEYVTKSENTLSIQTAQDWYTSTHCDQETSKTYSILATLVIKSENKNTLIITDDTWTASNCEVVSSGFTTGETIDFRQEEFYMTKPSATILESLVMPNYSKSNLRHFDGFYQKDFHTVTPVSMVKLPNGNLAVDFGKVITGYVTAIATGKPGQKIRFYHTDDINDNNLSSNQKKVYSTYFLSKKYDEKCFPRFIVNTFRYIVIENWPDANISLSNFFATEIIPQEIPTPNFSLTTLDKNLTDSITNALVSHMGKYITDSVLNYDKDFCKRLRDEATICSSVFKYFDYRAFYPKWLDSFLQLKDNPQTLTIEECSFLTKILWEYYCAYHDTSLIEKYYYQILDSLYNLYRTENNPDFKILYKTKWLRYEAEIIKDFSHENIEFISSIYYIDFLKKLLSFSELLMDSNNQAKLFGILQSHIKSFTLTFTNPEYLQNLSTFDSILILFYDLCPQVYKKKLTEKILNLNQIPKSEFLQNMFLELMFRFGFAENGLKLIFQNGNVNLPSLPSFFDIFITYICGIKNAFERNENLEIAPIFNENIINIQYSIPIGDQKFTFSTAQKHNNITVSIKIPENLTVKFSANNTQEILTSGNHKFTFNNPNGRR